MPEKHKVLVIGSSGMLGIDLCNELRRDYEVYGCDLAVNEKSQVEDFIKCDITDAGSVSEAVLKFSPEVVVHTAAWTDVDACEKDPEKAYRVNFTGTENIAVACKKSGANLIYISTDFVFDGSKNGLYKETDKPSPLNIYAKSKLEGEEAVKKNFNNYFILRTSWLYGSNGKNFVDTIIAKSNTEKELKVVDDQVGSPTYTGDLSLAIHKLIDMIFSGSVSVDEVSGIYHVSNSGSVSWYEYAAEILRLTGSSTRVIPITSEHLARPAKRPAMSSMDCSKFSMLTGFKMRGWEAALKEYISKKG